MKFILKFLLLAEIFAKNRRGSFFFGPPCTCRDNAFVCLISNLYSRICSAKRICYQSLYARTWLTKYTCWCSYGQWLKWFEIEGGLLFQRFGQDSRSGGSANRKVSEQLDEAGTAGFFKQCNPVALFTSRFALFTSRVALFNSRIALFYTFVIHLLFFHYFCGTYITITLPVCICKEKHDVTLQS